MRNSDADRPAPNLAEAAPTVAAFVDGEPATHEAFLQGVAERLVSLERASAPRGRRASAARARPGPSRGPDRGGGAAWTPESPVEGGRTLAGGLASIVLVGGSDVFSRHLRAAQAAVRWDREPSPWSHAFLLADPIVGAPSMKDIRLLECRIAEPPEESGAAADGWPAPSLNGVRSGRLEEYLDPRRWPSICVIVPELPPGEAEAIVERASQPNLDRVRFPLWDLLGEWRRYAWGLGAVPNPLTAGTPMPSAAFLDFAYEAAHVDLVPGAAERTTCPEYLWNTARWWWQRTHELGRPLRTFHRIAATEPAPPTQRYRIDLPPRTAR